MPLPLANLAETAPARIALQVRVYKAPRLFELWHLASFDAPTVAIVWSLAFAWAAHVALPGWVPLLLALGTWSVYIGDRLLDARAGIRSEAADQLRDRHFFHWRYRRILLPLAIGSACVAAAMIFTLMPSPNREHNTLLAAAALAYFSGVHGPRQVPAWLQKILTKELLVGVIFTAGCAVPTLSRLGVVHLSNNRSFSFLPALFFFAALAWLNCHAIDRWENCASRTLSGVSALALSTMGTLAGSICLQSEPRIAMLFITGSVSAALLGLLHLARVRIAPLTLRMAADLVLLVPVFLVVH
ncbi:MAG: hypothetical protein KGN79_01305 [Acidobacteriota bacterium]|nr:hypothetical protein [Acidobacteriota bacterium]